MNPTKIKNLLIMAALLLVIYWSFVKPNAEGLAFSLGILLGAGSVIFRKSSAELVLVVAVLALLVGAIELRHGIGPQYFIGLLSGAISPLIAFKMQERED